jgi:putative PIN family toxin of toxin-antitoxin system
MSKKLSPTKPNEVIRKIKALGYEGPFSGSRHPILRHPKTHHRISVPLLFEYEDVLKRKSLNIALTYDDIDDILDYLCAVADKREIYYLWRPFLKDPKDDMVLELAVESRSNYIITHNIDDFRGIERFNVRAIKPKGFLKLIGEIK